MSLFTPIIFIHTDAWQAWALSWAYMKLKRFHFLWLRTREPLCLCSQTLMDALHWEETVCVSLFLCFLSAFGHVWSKASWYREYFSVWLILRVWRNANTVNMLKPQKHQTNTYKIKIIQKFISRARSRISPQLCQRGGAVWSCEAKMSLYCYCCTSLPHGQFELF